MARPRTDVLQGTLTLLVLRTLARGRLHGYAITSHIQRVSDDLLRVEEGSLYPALHRLCKRGDLDASWGETDTGRRARFYTITRQGSRRLAEQASLWERVSAAVNSVLASGKGDRPRSAEAY